LVRVSQNFRDSLAVFRQQLGMPFGDVTLPFLTQLDVTLQVRARDPAD
jgi:hypothetical protein